MLSRLGRDTLIYGGAHLSGRVVNLVLLPLFTAVLLPEDFGAVDLTLALASFALVTVALEVGQGLARSYPDASSDAERSRYAGTALAFGALAYGAFAVIGFGAIALVGQRVLGRADGPAIVGAGIAWVTASGMLTLAQLPLRFGLRPGAYALSNLALAVASGVAATLFVVVARLGPAGLLAGQATGAAVAVVVSLSMARPRPSISFDRPTIAEFLRFSVPLVPASIAVVATAWMDRVAIAASLSLDDLGQYAVAVRVGAVVGLIVTAFQAAMTPITYAYHRDPSTPGALARMARLYAAGAVVLIAGLAWLGPELVGVLAGTRYSGAIPILPAVAAVPLLAGFANFAPGLALARSTLRMGLIAIAGAVVTTVLNFTLVPRIGIIAAAWSSAIGTGAALLLTISQAQARYRIPWEGVSLASAAAIAIVLALLVPALHSAGIATFPARSGIFASVLVIVALVGLIQGRDLRAIYRSVRRSREREETG